MAAASPNAPSSAARLPEMPGFYPEDEYDLAGFTVGIVDEPKKIDGSKLAAGDVLVGLASSGVHSNGYSLVRKTLDINNTYAQHSDELGCTLGEALLVPTRIYVRAIEALSAAGVDVHAISHITGGGFYENVPRMMQPGLTAHIDVSTFPMPRIFRHHPKDRQHSRSGYVQHLQHGHRYDRRCPCRRS